MSALESSVDSAVVRIAPSDAGYDGRSAAFLGSGFFVAPGWVLTCAHVVGKGAGTVTAERDGAAFVVTANDGQEFEARVACLLEEAAPDVPRQGARGPGTTLHALPDIALLRVPDATDPECVWLSDRSDLSSPDIGVYGWAWDPGTGPVPVQSAGSATGGRNGRPLMLNGAALTSGCSGGPVVDHQRGEVIGLSKSRLKSGGGLAVPVTELRALWDSGAAARRTWREVVTGHDLHHRERFLRPGTGWPNVQEELPGRGGGLAPALRTALYAHFAALPQPDDAGEVLALVNEVRGKVLRTAYGETEIGRPLHHWREGAGLLHDPRDGSPSPAGDTGSLEPEAVMLYAAKVHALLAGPSPVVPAGRTPQPVPSAVPGAGAGPGDGSAPVDHSTPSAGGGLPDPRLPDPRVPDPRLPDPRGYGDEQRGHQHSEEREQQPRGPESADPTALAALRAWILEHRTSLRNEHIRDMIPGVLDAGRPRESPYADVLVEIDRDFFGRRAWRVKLLRADGTVTPVRNNETGVPREQLESDIRDTLAKALDLGDVGGYLASVDVLVDRDLFDEPVDEWRVRVPEPGEGFDLGAVPLGRRRVVVLRDRKRSGTHPAPEWHGRWKGAENGPLEAAPLCGTVPGPEDCPDHGAEHGRTGGRVPAESEGATYARLSSLPNTAVPVHCGPLGSGRAAAAADIALGIGHAALLWRRGEPQRQGVPDELPCTGCAEFHDRAARLLHEAGTGRNLAERVRDLRKGNSDPRQPDPAGVWARNIVLVYDPPAGTAPAAPLREPQLQTGQWK